jgi:hypothetical protein
VVENQRPGSMRPPQLQVLSSDTGHWALRLLAVEHWHDTSKHKFGLLLGSIMGAKSRGGRLCVLAGLLAVSTSTRGSERDLLLTRRRPVFADLWNYAPKPDHHS